MLFVLLLCELDQHFFDLIEPCMTSPRFAAAKRHVLPGAVLLKPTHSMGQACRTSAPSGELADTSWALASVGNFSRFARNFAAHWALQKPTS
jgi:hypothetical protein